MTVDFLRILHIRVQTTLLILAGYVTGVTGKSHPTPMSIILPVCHPWGTGSTRSITQELTFHLTGLQTKIPQPYFHVDQKQLKPIFATEQFHAHQYTMSIILQVSTSLPMVPPAPSLPYDTSPLVSVYGRCISHIRHCHITPVFPTSKSGLMQSITFFSLLQMHATS